jgi:hypothetical protein
MGPDGSLLRSARLATIPIDPRHEQWPSLLTGSDQNDLGPTDIKVGHATPDPIAGMEDLGHTARKQRPEQQRSPHPQG